MEIIDRFGLDREEKMNLYQYLPPHSCHPQSTLKGMIYSLMRTYYKQNTYKQDYVDTVITMFHHLLTRGWDRYVLKDLILAANVKLQQLDLQVRLQENQAITVPPTIREQLFFHLPFTHMISLDGASDNYTTIIVIKR